MLDMGPIHRKTGGRSVARIRLRPTVVVSGALAANASLTRDRYDPGMRTVKALLFTAVLVSITPIASVIGTTAPVAAAQQCRIELRVNVFGGGSSIESWSAAGGLNTGSSATLRAISRGCFVDGIGGRWVAGRSGAVPTQTCATRFCLFTIASDRQSAADFQAFSNSGGRLVRSNVVRVAWAGGVCSAEGGWSERSTFGEAAWAIDGTGVAIQTGLGNATGMATFAGHLLRITWVTANGTAGIHEVTLSPNCQSGNGHITITAPAARSGQTVEVTFVKV